MSIRSRGLEARLAGVVALVLCGPAVVPSGASAGSQIVAGSASGAPGDQVAIDVSLAAGGAVTSALQNDLGFDPSIMSFLAAADGSPDCTVNPATGKLGGFAFEPFGCVGAACTSIRGLLFNLDQNPIPDGLLYTCRIAIAPTALPATYPLSVFGVVLSTPEGTAVPDTSGVDGSLTVLAPCGNGALDVGEQCDDGNTSGGDLCPAGCRYVDGHSAIRGNVQKPTKDRAGCQVEWYVVDPSNPLDRYGLPTRDQKCADQDPTCDFDPTPGRCRFEVVACASNDDPSLPACAPNGIATFRLRDPRPIAPRDPVRQAILTADAEAVNEAFLHLLDPLDPGAGYTSAVPLDATRRNLCSAPFAIDALTKKAQHGPLRITTRTTDQGLPRARTNVSRLRLTCE